MDYLINDSKMKTIQEFALQIEELRKINLHKNLQTCITITLFEKLNRLFSKWYNNIITFYFIHKNNRLQAECAEVVSYLANLRVDYANLLFSNNQTSYQSL